MKVLIVDDEAEFTELMQSRLGKRGIEASTACSGEEALALIQSTEFDVVVLDVKLAGENGIEVLQKIKKVNADLPVLLLSGHANAETAIKGVESGAVDYLLKPVPLNDLIARFAAIVFKK